MADIFGAPGVQFRGLTDIFPSLGSFIQENRNKALAPQRARSEKRALGLLGEEGTSFEQFGQGDTANFGQVQEATGLMADPESFYNQMKYSMGLMATPGYQQAGQTFAQQAMQSQLGMRQARQDQNNWMVNQARLQAETDAANALAAKKDKRAEEKGIFDQQQTLAKEYTTAAAPYRATAELMTGTQNIVQTKGFEGMSIADDVEFIKGLAKMILPNEAVMSDDADMIARVDLAKYPGMGIAKIMAAQVNGGLELSVQQRQDLYESMHRKAGQSMTDYNTFRDEFKRKTVEYGLDPRQTIRQDQAGSPGGYQNLLNQPKVNPVTGQPQKVYTDDDVIEDIQGISPRVQPGARGRGG